MANAARSSAAAGTNRIAVAKKTTDTTDAIAETRHQHHIDGLGVPGQRHAEDAYHLRQHRLDVITLSTTMSP